MGPHAMAHAARPTQYGPRRTNAGAWNAGGRGMLAAARGSEEGKEQVDAREDAAEAASGVR